MSDPWFRLLTDGRGRGLLMRAIILMLLCVQGSAPVYAVTYGKAEGCVFSSYDGFDWVEVTPLTRSTPVGSVLKQRQVNPIVEYTTGKSVTKEPHELIVGAHFPGIRFLDGIVPTNIDGISFKVTAYPSGSDAQILTGNFYPLVLKKYKVESSNGELKKDFMNYVYSLILTRPANELPKGSLQVNSLAGVQVAMYALDLDAGVAQVGQHLQELPPHNNRERCAKELLLNEHDLLGSEGVKFTAKCQVVTRNVTLPLGSPSAHDFPTLGSTSPPSVMKRLEVNDCSFNSLPKVSFSAEPASRCDPSGILGLTQDPGRSVAKGVGIVMFNEQIPRIHCNGTQYAMERPSGSDSASFSFRAQYIRTGPITEGSANSSAQFNFTFD
ncbi:Pilin (type 1 fimbria component protein) [Pseudomonas saponiphila]|uniref:Pilin (Type 1 fimbria component protein) n=1 Tax=Pseudomonas saponiphila TaxID=556534 RepID=A0A1H4Y5U8_9PSED|nr:fimbrial protein [Pseudomonas saponiphila]SED13249.1 Pilin (type 1 fimbria component protein) [Pseudomonas saponiphila]